MKQNIITNFFVGTICLFATITFAEQGRGWQSGSPYNRLFNANTIETVQGEIISVDRIEHKVGRGVGIHLQLRTENETIAIHLGPAWYLDQQDLKLIPKDKIDVRGSRITFDGKPAIIAIEVNKGKESLLLRDENGIPTWSGWRRK